MSFLHSKSPGPIHTLRSSDQKKMSRMPAELAYGAI
jgi:hypothetical protein